MLDTMVEFDSPGHKFSLQIFSLKRQIPAAKTAKNCWILYRPVAKLDSEIFSLKNFSIFANFSLHIGLNIAEALGKINP